MSAVTAHIKLFGVPRSLPWLGALAVAVALAMLWLWPFSFAMPGVELYPERYIHLWEIALIVLAVGGSAALAPSARNWESPREPRVVTARLVSAAVLLGAAALLPILAWLLLAHLSPNAMDTLVPWNDLDDSSTFGEMYTHDILWRFVIFGLQVVGLALALVAVLGRVVPLVIFPLPCLYLMAYQSDESPLGSWIPFAVGYGVSAYEAMTCVVFVLAGVWLWVRKSSTRPLFGAPA